MVSRFSVLITAVLGAYLALFVRLYHLQVQEGVSYVKQADAQSASGVLVADRGVISFTDKYGKQLSAATNKNFPLVYATPKTIGDAQEVAHAVAPELGLEVSAVVKLLSKPNDDYELLARKANGDAADRIAEKDIPGIYVKDTPARFYPLNALAAHLVGFVGPSDVDDGVLGKYGVEAFYDTELAGTSGEIANGRLVPPTAGTNIQLTVDPSVQTEAERILRDAVSKHRAEGGSVIVQDPASGKILAMGSTPNFDPNEYAAFDIQNFLNPAVQEIYEPGSVFKVITMAAGIDAGKITPQTTFNDTGVLEVSGRKIKNWDLAAHGLVTMTNVIEKSLNTGAAFAERQTGHATFLSYLQKFGFGEKTGVDLPGEVKGDLRRLTAKDAPAVAFATASFGQGVAVTALEMVNGIAAIANGGILMRPYVNAALGPQEVRRAISANTAKQVTAMMVSAVDKAVVAKVDGYTFAGKTGTAQVPDFVHGGYSDDVIHTYVGFGPTADPKFIILLKLDKPAGAPLAGTTVVPAFRDLAEFLVNYYNIPPDRAGTQ